MDEFESSIRDRLAAGSDFLSKALVALVVDTLKKRSETTKKLTLKRALKRKRVEADEEAEVADVPEPEAPEAPVVIWIADPLIRTHKNQAGNDWLSDIKEWRKLAILETRDLAAIMKAISSYLPQARTIREIRGALEDPDPLVDMTLLTDWMSLKTDAEVKAFLVHTKSQPIRLLVVMYRNDGTQDLPAPDPAVPYSTTTEFDPPETYNDPAEDSDQLVRDANNLTSRRMPLKDHTFEQRKWQIQQWIQRQQCLLQKMKMAHVTTIDNTMTIDSEDEGFCFQRHLQDPVPKTGQQRVLARQVVAPAVVARDAALAAALGPLLAKMRGHKAAQTAWDALNV